MHIFEKKKVVLVNTRDERYYETLDKKHRFNESVTGFKKKFFGFEKEKIIKSLISNKMNKKYFGRTYEDVEWIWRESAFLGSLVHAMCEYWVNTGNEYLYKNGDFEKMLNGKSDDIPNEISEVFRENDIKKINSIVSETRKKMFKDETGLLLNKEFGHFKKYIKMMDEKGYKVFTYKDSKGNIVKGVEIKIYHIGLGIAGTFDVLLVNKKDPTKFILGDNKRTSDRLIKLDVKNGKYKDKFKLDENETNIYKVLKDYQSFLNTKMQNGKTRWYFKKFFEYGLQLSIYRHMLLTEYISKEFNPTEIRMHIIKLWHDEDDVKVVEIPTYMYDERLKLIEKLMSSCKTSIEVDLKKKKRKIKDNNVKKSKKRKY